MGVKEAEDGKEIITVCVKRSENIAGSQCNVRKNKRVPSSGGHAFRIHILLFLGVI